MVHIKNVSFAVVIVCILFNAVAYSERSPGVEFKRSFFKSYKGITSQQKGASLWVLENGEPLLELRDKRYLHFRSAADNDHWVGTFGRPMDLCFSYSDVTEYEDRQVDFSKTDGGFKIEAWGTKPSVDGKVKTVITATRRAKDGQFEYILESRLEYSVEKWHSVSSIAKRAKGKEARIAPLNFHINRVSIPDLYQSKVSNKELLYDGLVFSHDGRQWLRRPKIHIPYVIRQGDYPTIAQDIEYAAGDYYGFVDIEEGGWMIEILDASSPFTFGLCWMFFDIHHVMNKGIVALEGSGQRAEAGYKLSFKRVSNEQAKQILDSSQEVEWRSRKEYADLPLFSWDSRFDKLLTDADVDPNAKFIWWPSSYDCFRDDTVGFDDDYSVSIKLDKGRAVWYNSTWGAPYDTQERLKGMHRISVMVKTQDVVGEVRLAMSWSDGDKWLRPSGWSSKDAVWKIAQKSLTGTNDWTLLTLELDPGSQFQEICSEVVKRTIVLEQIGAGQSWFDNVKIEKIE